MFRILPSCFGWAIGLLLLLTGTHLQAQTNAWEPADNPIMSRWAQEVSPDNVHSEYPRPQMVRQKWKNLNGLWQYKINQSAINRPNAFKGEILVPFPVESALSGVKQRIASDEHLWYTRTFTVPDNWSGQRVLLHFGAIDWETTVWVNGHRLGSHTGGYDPFTFDITDALTEQGEQEITVSVWDPTDQGSQPRGKQVSNPGGIWYTPTTGIWQTVWLEPVAPTYIEDLQLTPDIDREQLEVAVEGRGTNSSYTVRAVALADGQEVGQAEGPATEPVTVSVPNPNLWSPDTPFLYELHVELWHEGTKVDDIESYFGMRKIALGKDANGVTRLMLNNKPLFQYGLLDQGFWPGGLYTPPTDEAMRYDIKVTKALGFNMARKHVKVAPARWYYWADKLGLLVWQDMPNGGRHIRPGRGEIERSTPSAEQFEQEYKQLIDTYYNHPSIVMWVPFNEGWGQYDTKRIARLTKRHDPTRLVNSASGWNDMEVGDVHDIHSYPGPEAPQLEKSRATVLGEYGGLGLPLKNHTWQSEENWGYESYESRDELTQAYLNLLKKLRPMITDQGLAAAIYTQTSDVEVEVNGVMTYDRAVIKMDTTRTGPANRSLYDLIDN